MILCYYFKEKLNDILHNLIYVAYYPQNGYTEMTIVFRIIFQ